MLKVVLQTVLICCALNSLLAQTAVQLNINHKFDKSDFVLGQVYLDDNNNALSINRLNYYISNINLRYDAGQTTSIDAALLIQSDIENYTLGSINTLPQELESIEFDLGVHSTNQPTDFPSGHALSTSSMYSNNENSYIMIAVEGLIDSDGNQIPDKAFKLLATGDQLIRTISVAAKTASENNQLNINLNANISKLIKNIDLINTGIQENAAPDNQQLCDNAKYENVFSNISTTGVSELVSPQNHINVDSRLSIAPTIHYKFYTTEEIDMTITNLNGSFFIQRFNLFPEGNFYLDQNLAAGMYIVIFTSPKGIRQSKRFIVRN